LGIFTILHYLDIPPCLYKQRRDKLEVDKRRTVKIASRLADVLALKDSGRSDEQSIDGIWRQIEV
jgi:hypothetical protein